MIEKKLLDLIGNNNEDCWRLIQSPEQGNLKTRICLDDRYRGIFSYEDEYKMAMSWIIKAARQGDKGLVYNLAVCYERGEGISRDDDKAIYWYTQAANYGDADAQFVLYIYQSENRFPSDWERKMNFLFLLAKEENVNAQYELGACYENIFDYNGAVYWYAQASNQNYGPALLALGRCYENGLGVDKDYQKALSYYRLSFKNGCYEANKYIYYLTSSKHFKK